MCRDQPRGKTSGAAPPLVFPLVDPSTLGRKTLYELASLVHCYNSYRTIGSHSIEVRVDFLRSNRIDHEFMMDGVGVVIYFKIFSDFPLAEYPLPSPPQDRGTEAVHVAEHHRP